MKNTSSRSKNESKSQIIFNQYLRSKKMNGYFELKETTKGIFYFKQIEKHQLEGLEACEESGLVWKLSDEDRRQKPCDTLCIPPMPAYVVLRFDQKFYLIRIRIILAMIRDGLVGMNEKTAGTLAEKVIHNLSN